MHPERQREDLSTEKMPKAETEASNPAPSASLAKDGGQRPLRPYRKPCLAVFGDVRDATLGSPTPGIGDSGNPSLFKP